MGTVTAGISIARTLPRNRKITKTTQPIAIRQGVIDFANRGLDEYGFVVAVLDHHAFGQIPVEPFGQRDHRVGHIDGVGGRLLDHADAHHGNAVTAEESSVLDKPQFDPGNIAQAHQVAVIALADNEIVEVIGALEIPVHAGAEHALVGLQHARGQFHVFRAHGTLDIAHAQLPGSHCLAIQPDTHGVAETAADAHARDAVERGILVDQITLGVVGQLRHAHAIAGQVAPHDHIVVAIGFLYFRRLRFFGEVIGNARYAVAHVVGRGVDIPIDGKFDGDGRFSILRCGFDELDAFDSGNTFLDDLGDSGFDDIGGGAGVGDLDRDHRRVDVGVFPQRQSLEGNQAEGYQQNGNDAGKYGSLDRNVG